MSLFVTVHVREADFRVNCGHGKQTIRWLAFLVARLYGSRHPEYDTSRFTPVHVAMADGLILFPDDKIGIVCRPNAHVFVHLLGPERGINDQGLERESSLWEQYMFQPPSKENTVEIEYEADDILDEPPHIVGNFNNWTRGVAMVKVNPKDPACKKYRARFVFPADAEICFGFDIKGKGMALSNSYNEVETVITDPDGQPRTVRLNYLKVKDPDMQSNYSDLRLAQAKAYHYKIKQALRKKAQTESKKKRVKTVAKKQVGLFKRVTELSEEDKRKIFELDWAEVQIVDVCRKKAVRNTLKDALWKHNDFLRMVYRFYSSQGGRDLSYMSVLKWIHLAHTCRIPDDRMTVGKLDLIFHRVNVEEQFDEEAAEDDPEGYTAKMTLVDDPLNPDNQFIRGEFYEGLIRVALMKYRKMDPAPALEKLMDEHLMPYAMSGSTTDLRAKLGDPDVQRAFNRFSSQLWATFRKYACSNKDALEAVKSRSMDLREYEMFLREFDMINKQVSRRVALSAFAMSQAEALTSKEVNPDAAEMTYAEFLEAVARLAEARYTGWVDEFSGEDLPLAQKVHNILMYMYRRNNPERKGTQQQMRETARLEAERRAKEAKEQRERQARERRQRKKAERDRKRKIALQGGDGSGK